MELSKPVAYLEDNDFNKQGQPTNPHLQKGKLVVMMQASWCPHCQTAKPAFQKFANKHEGSVVCATIQSDGDRQSEKDLGARLNELKKSFRGFPDYILFINGEYVEKDIEGRDINSLEQFADV